MKTRVFIKSPMNTLPFPTCFWSTEEEVDLPPQPTPQPCARPDTRSSGSKQEFPKIVQLTLRDLIKQAESDLDSSPTAAAPRPGDLELLT
jgi:hypothetical protein